MKELFYFEKEGLNSMGEIIIPKNPRKTGSTIIDKGTIIKGQPNLISHIKSKNPPSLTPLYLDWNTFNKLFEGSIDHFHPNLIDRFFSQEFEFRTLETKKIDFSQETSLKIESTKLGSEFNFPAHSLFIINENSLGFNSEPLKNGKSTPISKIYSQNAKKYSFSPYRTPALIFEEKNNIFLEIEDQNLIENPDTISLYFLLCKKGTLQLIDIEYFDLNNRIIPKYLFEIVVKIEDFIDYIRKNDIIIPNLKFLVNVAEEALKLKKVKSNLYLRNIASGSLSISDCQKNNVLNSIYESPNKDNFRFNIDSLNFNSKSTFSNTFPSFLNYFFNSIIHIYFERYNLKLNQLFLVFDNIKDLEILRESINSEIPRIKSEIDLIIQELETHHRKNGEKLDRFLVESEKILQEFMNNPYSVSNERSPKGYYYSPSTYLPDKIKQIITNL